MAESESTEDSGVKLAESDQGPGVTPAPGLPKPKLRTVKQSDTPERIAGIYGVDTGAIKGEVRPGKVVQVDTSNANPLGTFLAKTNEVLSMPGNLAVGFAKGAYDVAKQASAITERVYKGEGVDPAEAFQLTLEVGGGGIMTSAAVGARASKNTLGMFLGPNSKNLSQNQKNKMTLAKQMLKDGKDKQEVWDETGWAMDPLGNMRTELPGNKITMDLPKVMKEYNNRGGKEDWFLKTGIPLKDVWQNADELFKHYPQLKDIRVRFGDTGKANAHFDQQNGEIVFSRQIHDNLISAQKQLRSREAEFKKGVLPKELYQRSKERWTKIIQDKKREMEGIMRHEVHHGIAQIEQWPLGNNTVNAAGQARGALMAQGREALSKFNSKYEKLFPGQTPPDITRAARAVATNKIVPGSALEKQVQYFEKNFPDDWAEQYYIHRADYMVTQNASPNKGLTDMWYQLYRRDAGEVDARNVQNMRDNPMLEGRNYKRHPDTTADVPVEKQHFASDPKNYRSPLPLIED